MGKIKRILAGQYTHAEKLSAVIPKKLVTGVANRAADEPVTANTTSIMTNWKLE